MTGDAESYGCCLVCGATRAVEHLEADGGVGLRVVCPNPACPSLDGWNEEVGMTGQQGGTDPALSAAIDAWHKACHADATIEDGMRLVVDAVRSADLPPLAELVTDEDMEAALDAGSLSATPSSTATMRAALEVYGARLLGRIGPQDKDETDRPEPLTAEEARGSWRRLPRIPAAT